ncbi:hypothetical protein GCM10010399_45270 [Dactylosporangium fulvum]|uniref:UPF0235 protein Dfulv_38875 n=1 Tax=Dactylosporangium fulvum TaxID=53359 RepID=A0ABY5VTD9_9ACTN|nr:DUF167 domain-containing protein [Dactylosporangium fulvum]UWP81038.1 DUF167 domain-containing protein [Dactylosporangium fulvum]
MVTIAIRVRPGASRTAVGGSYPGPYGPALVVAVGARPVEGQANEAALRALADAIKVRPSALRLKAGATSRDKLVELDDAPAGLQERLAALLETTR